MTDLVQDGIFLYTRQGIPVFYDFGGEWHPVSIEWRMRMMRKKPFGVTDAQGVFHPSDTLFTEAEIKGVCDRIIEEMAAEHWSGKNG